MGYLAHDSNFDEAIAAACNMSMGNINEVILHPDIKENTPLKRDMASWIDSLIEMIDLLLNNFDFQCIGNWTGYLHAIDEFLPWCLSLNRQNYIWNSSYYFPDMRALAIETLLPTAISQRVDSVDHLALQSILSFEWIRL